MPRRSPLPRLHASAPEAMVSDKSRDHRLRVLENQKRIAAKDVASVGPEGDPQMTMPLIVEVKTNPVRSRGRRLRKRSKGEQPSLGDM